MPPASVTYNDLYAHRRTIACNSPSRIAHLPGRVALNPPL